eukprot:NODE_864_length_3613_cov_0.374787.p3 type:complete len:289 gc:universal NODE_864_length_3613_cov_0.374787:291-1157(+)
MYKKNLNLLQPMQILYNQQRLIKYEKLITKKFDQPVKEYKDRYQISLDVKRSFTNLKVKPQKELQDALDYVFYHTQMSYVQGFHDICATLIIISENAKYIAYSLAMNQFAPFLTEDGIETAELMCKHAFTIIRIHDKLLFNFIKDVQPSFFISWVLTAFQHDVTCLESKLLILDLVVLESFDFLVYITCSFIMYNRSNLIHYGKGDKILSTCSELRHLGDIQLEEMTIICRQAFKFRQKYPYDKVKTWKEDDIERMCNSRWPIYISAILAVLLAILIMQYSTIWQQKR